MIADILNILEYMNPLIVNTTIAEFQCRSIHQQKY